MDIFDKFKEKVKEKVSDFSKNETGKIIEKGVEAATGINISETKDTIKSIFDLKETNPEKIDYRKQGFEDSKRNGGHPYNLKTNLNAIESMLLSHYGKVSADKIAENAKANEKIENLKKEQEDIPNKITDLEQAKKKIDSEFEQNKKNINEEFNKEKESIIQEFNQNKAGIMKTKDEDKTSLEKEKESLQKEYDDEKEKTENNYSERIRTYKETIKEAEGKIKDLGTNIKSSISLEFVIEGVLLILITFFLFIFYSSVVNSALFKTFVLTENSEIDKLIISSIFDPEALSTAKGMQLAYLCSAPAVFLTLGFVLHLCLITKDKVKKWISASAVVTLAFIFDGLLAFSISKKIFDMTSPLKFGVHEVYCFYTDTNFWVTIFFGFVVYIFWGVLFSAFIKAWNPEYKKLKNQIIMAEKEIGDLAIKKKTKIEEIEKDYDGKIIKKKNQINNLDEIYNPKFSEIESKKTDAEEKNKTKRDNAISELETDKNSKILEIDEEIRNYQKRLEEIPKEIGENKKIIVDNDRYRELQPETEHFFDNYYDGWHEWICSNVSNESQKNNLEFHCIQAKTIFSDEIKTKYNWGDNR